MKFTLSMPGTKLAELPRITVGMHKDEVESVLELMPSFYGAFQCDRKQKQMRFLECGNNKVTVTALTAYYSVKKRCLTSRSIYGAKDQR